MFFSHPVSQFVDSRSDLLTLGSDEEKAIHKAMTFAFSGANTVICSRHVRENALHKLDSVLGSTVELRRTLKNAIFGDSGLAACKDVIRFEETARALRPMLDKAPTAFSDYFDRYLVHSLRENVTAGRRGWTNNDCESVNHVLKQSIQWPPQQLPQLIHKLRELVTAQYMEADRAVCGRGDLMLVPSAVRHRVTINVWKQMSADQQQKVSDTCFRFPASTSVGHSVSTDGQISVPATPSGGKKPHHINRSRRVATRPSPFRDAD